MTNGGSSTGGRDGQKSSSNPTQNEDSPRRRQPTVAGENAPPRSPQRRGPLLVMGVPGQSAFTPYSRPPSSNYSHFPSPGSSSGVGFGFPGAGHGFHGALAVPVGGSGTYGGVAPLRIGGSPSARKRGREGGAAAAGGGGANNNNNPVNCSVCGKAFLTPKALFGHMRSHPDRGWKGAHPPPAFKAEEEFADLGALIRPEAAAAAGEEDGAGGGGAERVAEGAREEEEEDQYRLPDLNNPPPPEAN